MRIFGIEFQSEAIAYRKIYIPISLWTFLHCSTFDKFLSESSRKNSDNLQQVPTGFDEIQ